MKFSILSSRNNGLQRIATSTHSFTTHETKNESTAGNTTLTEAQCAKKEWQWRGDHYKNDSSSGYSNVSVVWREDCPKWDSGSADYTIQKQYKMSYGGNQAHNHSIPALTMNSQSNLPPYITVYMYKRIA